MPDLVCSPKHLASADVIAGRKTMGSIQGKITFGGHTPTRSFLRRYTGYVEQFGARPCQAYIYCVLAAELATSSLSTKSLCYDYETTEQVLDREY